MASPLTSADIFRPRSTACSRHSANYATMRPLPAVIVRGYTASQKPETSVPASGMSASISIADPCSVTQLASTLCNSTVSGWESITTRIRSRLAASKTASTLRPLWYRIVILISVLPPAFEVIVQRQGGVNTLVSLVMDLEYYGDESGGVG